MCKVEDDPDVMLSNGPVNDDFLDDGVLEISDSCDERREKVANDGCCWMD